MLTGGFSAVVDFGLLQFLHEVCGLQVDLLKALGSFIAGTMTAYLINRRWTLRPRRAEAGSWR